jgi:RNA polymerase-binding transcription factor DksA
MVDAAQALEEAERAAGIRRVRIALGDADAARAIAARACADCGDEIPLERLIARPDAARCTPCAARREREERG